MAPQAPRRHKSPHGEGGGGSLESRFRETPAEQNGSSSSPPPSAPTPWLTRHLPRPREHTAQRAEAQTGRRCAHGGEPAASYGAHLPGENEHAASQTVSCGARRTGTGSGSPSQQVQTGSPARGRLGFGGRVLTVSTPRAGTGGGLLAHVERDKPALRKRSQNNPQRTSRDRRANGCAVTWGAPPRPHQVCAPVPRPSRSFPGNEEPDPLVRGRLFPHRPMAGDSPRGAPQVHAVPKAFPRTRLKPLHPNHMSILNGACAPRGM